MNVEVNVMKILRLIRMTFCVPALLAGITMINVSFAMAQGSGELPPDGKPLPSQISREGDMTLDKMRTLIKRLDEDAVEARPGTFLFLVNDYEVSIFSSVPANRMRVMVRIRDADKLEKKDLLRILQANLDAALDARYAIGRGSLWSVFIHPLSNLHPKQFLEGVGATVNLAATYGSTFTSGQVVFGAARQQRHHSAKTH